MPSSFQEILDAVTVQEMGWANVKNGKLLRSANEAGFDVFVTVDGFKDQRLHGGKDEFFGCAAREEPAAIFPIQRGLLQSAQPRHP